MRETQAQRIFELVARTSSIRGAEITLRDVDYHTREVRQWGPLKAISDVQARELIEWLEAYVREQKSVPTARREPRWGFDPDRDWEQVHGIDGGDA